MQRECSMANSNGKLIFYCCNMHLDYIKLLISIEPYKTVCFFIIFSVFFLLYEIPMGNIYLLVYEDESDCITFGEFKCKK